MPRPSLPPAVLEAIRAALEGGATHRAAAEAVGVSVGAVGRVARNSRRGPNPRKVRDEVLSALADSLLKAPRPSVATLRETHGVSYSTVRKVADELGVDLSIRQPRQLPQGRRFRSQQEFLEALPSDPKRWREIVDWSPFFYDRKTGAQLPNRAQAVIMAMARNPDGSFKHADDVIANAVGYRHTKSVATLLTEARAAGLPIPFRNIGMGGATAPVGGTMTQRILEAGERALRARKPLTAQGIAEALGRPQHGRTVYHRLYQMATGRTTEDPALMKRAQALLNAAPSRKRNTQYLLPWLAASLGAPYAASRLNDDDGMM